MNCISPYTGSAHSSPSIDNSSVDRRSYTALEKQDALLDRGSQDRKRTHASCVSPVRISSGDSPVHPMQQLHHSHEHKKRDLRNSPNSSLPVTPPSPASTPRYRYQDAFDDEEVTTTPSMNTDRSVALHSTLSSSRSSRAPTPTVNNTSRNTSRGLSFASSSLPPDHSSLMNTMNLISSESGSDSEDEDDSERQDLSSLQPSPTNNRSIKLDPQPFMHKRPSPKMRQFPYNKNNNDNSDNTEAIPKHYHPAYWTKRLARREIYSRRYRPSPPEREELAKMEEFLGIPEARRSRKTIIVQQWRHLNPSPSQATEQNIPMSIILKRGPVCWSSYDECELILLTRGFVIARKVFQYSPKFQMGERWTNVERIASTGLTSFTIECADKTIDFTCPTVMEQQAWMAALRIVVVQAFMNQQSLLDSDDTANDASFQPGWQYQKVQTPWFTEAVTGQIQLEAEVMDQMDNSTINTLDSYNGWSPLHYAVRGHNVDAVRFLLQAGADPNLPDGLGRTPVQYAEEDQLPKSVLDLLKTYGGKGPNSGQICAGSNEGRSKRKRCRLLGLSIVLLILIATGVTTFLIWFLGKENSNSASALSSAQSSAVGDENDLPSDPAEGETTDSAPPPFLVVGVNPFPATNLTTGTSTPSDENSDTLLATSDEQYVPESLAEFVTNQTVSSATTATSPASTSPPTSKPTAKPTFAPTSAKPTLAPTSSKPTFRPATAVPLESSEFLPQTTESPTFAVTRRPTTSSPTALRTVAPTTFPTSAATDSPTATLTAFSTSSLSLSIGDLTSFPTFEPTFEGMGNLLPEDILLFELLVDYSFDNGASLRNPNSPQYRAFRWLSGNTELSYYSDDRKIQRYALATLFYSTEGEKWSNNQYWMSDEDECDMWFSRISEVVSNAVCNSDKQMITLDLDYNNLSGPLVKEVFLLKHLQRIELYGGPSRWLTGTIPSEIGLLQKLESFSVRGNKMTGEIPSELGLCGALSSLNLSQNRFSGSLPSTLGMLSSLESISLEANRLFGSMPSELGQISSLESLSLGTNSLTGTIFTEIGLLNALRGFNAEMNGLASEVPSEIGLLGNLTMLHVSDNRLSGKIPSHIGLLTGLQSIQLRGNSLEGMIPASIGSLTELGTLDLSYNRLSGPIPPELGRVSRLRSLLLNSNGLSGAMPPEMAALSRLNTLRLEQNKLVGEVPTDVCEVFLNTYPVFYADCLEVACPCCSYCCSEEGGCQCVYKGTMNEFLC